MTALVEQAHAKVNLYLHITGRRPDGYHLLDSLFVYVDLADTLMLQPATALTLDIDGPFGRGLETDGNIILRAADMLAEELGLAPTGALSLVKNIPLAAGLGGGSADAAAALRALPKMWGRDIPRSTLERLALSLGADVPAAVDEDAAYVSGIGEDRRKPASLPEFYLLLTNPGVALNTAAVFKAYAALESPFSEPVAPLPADFEGFVAALDRTGNDLEAAAVALQPMVGEVLQTLRGASTDCRIARMSGSGATCFGLFKGRAEAEAAALSLAIDHGWWAWAGGLKI